MPRSSQTRMVWPPPAVSVASMTSSSGWPSAIVQQQPPRGLARVHPPGAFRPAGKKAKAELTAQAQVALDLADPAGQTAGIGECRPQVVDIGVEAVLHAHDALAIR